MSNKANVNPVIKEDIQRYKKNKLASMLAILGIVFCCIYFVVLYADTDKNSIEYFYKWPFAIDVIYNLLFLLFVFLFSEQVKNYNRKMFWLQLAFGVMQIVRIFWLPLAGITETAYSKIVGVEYVDKELAFGSFVVMAVSLAASGACVVASAVIGFIRAKSLENFNAKLASGEVDIDATLKALDAEDNKKATAVAENAESVEEVTNA